MNLRHAVVLLLAAFASPLSNALAQCRDPTLEPGRFKVGELEIEDTKTALVWFRCPGFAVAGSGGCDASMTVPADTWAAAMEAPRRGPPRRSAWRLASVEELDTIAASGCGYLINPGFIKVMFDTVWTRSEAGEGRVWRYGADRERVPSPRRPGTPYELLAQTIFVRNAP